MTDVREILEELGIGQYHDVFLEQGFDTWETILDITESDFDALEVKLGHRRRLQRKIANSRGLASDHALASPNRETPLDDDHTEEAISAKVDSRANGTKENHAATSTGKRKYRRHPKPDEHAPERPPSAYVIFSNKMREDLKGRQLSFTEIAKLVGENWQNLIPSEKEPFESQAFRAKERYNNELAEYKKTDYFKTYSEYLAAFKAKQANSSRGNTDSVMTDVSKRPKLENQNSLGSTSSTSSSTGRSVEILAAHHRDHSFGAWGHGSTPSPSTQLSGLPHLSMNGTLHPALGSNTTQVLPGYRDTLFGNVTPQQPTSWRDGVQMARDNEHPYPQQLPRIMNVTHRRTSLNLSSHERTSTNYSLPVPLLSSESTSGTTVSSVSSASNASFMTPRTPLDHNPAEQPPTTLAFPAKPLYELPPLRPPSLSPQTNISSSYSPPAVIPPLDYTTLNSRRGLTQATSTSLRPQIHRDIHDDLPLDPVSALIKAGEIVSRNSAQPSPPA